MNTYAYFDNASSTKECCPLTNSAPYANPSSLHDAGIESEQALYSAHSRLLRLIGADGKLVFTSGATESNNLAIFGTIKRNSRIITSEIEHPSVLEVFRHLEKQDCQTVYLKVGSDGRVSHDSLAEALTPDTSLVSLFYVNNETGTVNDIDALANLVKKTNPRAVFHTDAAQAFGKIRLTLRNVDCASFSAHKIHGPKGVGALYIKKNIRIAPMMFGGGQQDGIRPGTENVPGILGFCCAAETAFANLDKNAAFVSTLRDYLLNELKETNYALNPEACDNASPYILNISIDGIKGEVLLNALSADGFFISTGSACHARRGGASVVSKTAPERADSSVRISFSAMNTKEECAALAESLKSHVIKLRKVRIK